MTVDFPASTCLKTNDLGTLRTPRMLQNVGYCFFQYFHLKLELLRVMAEKEKPAQSRKLASAEIISLECHSLLKLTNSFYVTYGKIVNHSSIISTGPTGIPRVAGLGF